MPRRKANSDDLRTIVFRPAGVKSRSSSHTSCRLEWLRSFDSHIQIGGFRLLRELEREFNQEPTSRREAQGGGMTTNLNPEDCKKAAALVGKRVRFAHMPDANENYFVVIRAIGGMVELEGWTGYFGITGFIVQP